MRLRAIAALAAVAAGEPEGMAMLVRLAEDVAAAPGETGSAAAVPRR